MDFKPRMYPCTNKHLKLTYNKSLNKTEVFCKMLLQVLQKKSPIFAANVYIFKINFFIHMHPCFDFVQCKIFNTLH